MDNIPLSFQLGALLGLLALSAIFSMSETAMMAANRFRLRHLAQNGHRGARKAIALLEQTDKMLGVILLGNNLVNTAAATLVSVIALQMFGDEKWALGASTLIITFAILVFSEITPKIIGASYADRLAPIIAYLLTPLLRLCYPVVWFVNLFAAGLLRITGLSLRANEQSNRLSPEELRSLVLESSNVIPKKHQAILNSLFDLNETTVEHMMTPRRSIEILDLDQDWESVQQQLLTSHHSRLPVCHGSLDHLLGVLPVRRLLSALSETDFSETALLEQLHPPYYIPAGTAVFSQLSFFQENRQRIGFVVDEYGDILGLLTFEDIIEEIVGDFTTTIPGVDADLSWDKDGSAVVDGTRQIRDINRMLGLDLPLNGPKTLNGLILEYFQDIPDADVGLKLNDIAVEILQTRDRSIVTARIYRPRPTEMPASLYKAPPP